MVAQLVWQLASPWAKEPKLKSWWGQEFSLSISFRPTRPLIQWLPEDLSPRGKAAGA
jgi:hypothetical protein